MTEEEYFEKLGIGNEKPQCSSCCKDKCCKERELTCCDEDKLEKLLELLIEQRKFAIEHYWNRANYFWLFVAAFFVAYVETLPDKGGCCGNSDDSQMEWVNLLVCIGGLFSSICWYMANRGSKYWQENWELHINSISKKLGKPIFQILMNPKKHWNNVLSYYPYSFTRVNLFLNIVVILIWGVLLGRSICDKLDLLGRHICDRLELDFPVIRVIFGILGLLLLLLIVVVVVVKVHPYLVNFVGRKIKELKETGDYKAKEPFIFIDDNP